MGDGARTWIAWLAAAWLVAACAKDTGSSTSFGDGADAPATDATGDPSGDDGETSEGSEETSDTNPIFDVAGPGGGPDDDCIGDGEIAFSYIWIANSSEGTVSKINTFTGVEEGRYRTGPTNADPSRTSVNLHGDVAVVNRTPGGIAKIAARHDECVDQNGDDSIQTSSGPNDVLAWGKDECVLWYQDIPSSAQYNNGPRPVGWEPEERDEEGCLPNEARVWVGWYAGTAANVAYVRRLDGTTGETLDEVEIAGFRGAAPGHWDGWGGPYGGAVNGDGDFWVSGKPGTLVRLPADDPQAFELWREPDMAAFYGMALDPNGHPWISDWEGYVHHFDPDDESWTTIYAGGLLRGLMVDEEGIAWVARNFECALVKVDTQSETVVGTVVPGDCSMPVGISIDVEGYVWAVDSHRGAAYKVDPHTHELMLKTEGLVSPYTYSDMTGYGLRLAAEG